jgi:hypothetical protein
MPQFHIMRIEAGLEPEPYVDWDSGQVLILDNGAEAAALARTLSENSGYKFQPRPIKSNVDWKARERARLESGTYRALPWESETWFKRESTEHHFAHVSIKDASKIAFTETEAKGEADAQTTMKPGRYLKAHYGDVLDAKQITEATKVYAAYTNTSPDDEDSLLFATTADDIEHVYLSGPESCMSHDADDYRSPFHPVRVYAGFDLAVAYCKNEDGAIIARALCWPERKIYGRVYPGEHDGEGYYKLVELLRRDGFRKADLTGARFTLSRKYGDIVCPYIDGSQQVTVRHDCLVIGDDGSGQVYNADNTHGYVGEEEDDRPTCPHCDERYDDSDSRYVEDNSEYWCEYCADNNTHQCEATGNLYANRRHVVELSDGTIWARSYFEDHGADCDKCGDCHRADDIDARGHCEDCREDDDSEDDDSEDDSEPAPSPRIEHPDQLELPIAGAHYRIAILNGDSGPYVCFDGLALTITPDFALANRVLREMRDLYPRVSYMLETIPAIEAAA